MEKLTYLEFREQHPVSDTLMEEARKTTEETIRTYELKEARKKRHMTQEELSRKMGIGQKRVSALENGKIDVLKIDTLRRYVEGLGGTLEITAQFPERQIRLI
ncbi:helix-turn-helix domain-containing protein [uncultured Slackia sp.]|jgi:DNA-binding XRE family transcriptional regulator|uniref:helix-turn-helix domain-containing protein n=1 Tax=uncultured Slackia sp. TaxID=665903 RepID=UPI0025E3B10E|nr:helix-turn-helix domain-containing protein [uncultured Slackia sp.]